MFITIIIAVSSFVAVALFFFLAYGLAKRGADKGVIKNARQWDPSRIPLRLILNRRGLGKHLSLIEVTFIRAAEWWNEEASMKLIDEDILYWSDDPADLAVPNGIIEIKRGEGTPDDQFAGRAHITAVDGIIKSGWFEIDEDRLDSVDEEGLLLMVRHEFGHELGLADDEDPESIMYHSTIQTDRELTRKDRDLLQSAYYLKKEQA